jgi:hypothetical protein
LLFNEVAAKVIVTAPVLPKWHVAVLLPIAEVKLTTESQLRQQNANKNSFARTEGDTCTEPDGPAGTTPYVCPANLPLR